MVKKEDINKILDILEETYPQAECALDHQNVYQLIVAVALSAQTTDKSVNQVTPALFEKYPTPYELAVADPEEVAQYIKRIGMYKTKSKNIVGLAKSLVENFGGQVPDDYGALVSLPGDSQCCPLCGLRASVESCGYPCFPGGKQDRAGTRKRCAQDRACPDGQDTRGKVVQDPSQPDLPRTAVLRRPQAKMRPVPDSRVL